MTLRQILRSGRAVMRRAALAAVAAALLIAPVRAGQPGPHAYHVEPARSRASIHVGKAGAFSFVAGHTHEVTAPIESGSVDVDEDDPSRSHVGIVIQTSRLSVVSAGEPNGDAPKVESAMKSEKVLDVERYPRITFDSTSVSAKERSGNRLELVLEGRLTIRGTPAPVTVPVHVEFAGATLTATGRFTIKQTMFGIKPISVGGVVAVKDALDIDFSITASR